MFYDLTQLEAVRGRVDVTEDQEQAWLIQWAKRNSDEHPDLHFLFAIPNGGHRSKRQGALLKLTGVKAGVPDLFLPVPRNGKHGLFIEMKVLDPKKGKVRLEQSAWIYHLNAMGYQAIVCRGFEEARDSIVGYLGIGVE